MEQHNGRWMRYRLLVIEEDHNLRARLRQGLARAGYSVFAVASAAEGISVAQSTRFAAAILGLSSCDSDDAIETLLRLDRRMVILVLRDPIDTASCDAMEFEGDSNDSRTRWSRRLSEFKVFSS